MKQCPKCTRVYADDALNFCLDDGDALVETALDTETKTAILTGVPVRSPSAALGVFG